MKFKTIFSLFMMVSLFCPIPLMAADTLIKYTYSDSRSNRLGRVEIIDAVPERPTIFDIPDQVTEKNISATLSFTIGDDKTSANNLILTGRSLNTAVVPDENIAFGGSASNRTVTITPVFGKFGMAEIVITVKDGDDLTASDSFEFVIREEGPVLSVTPDQWDATETGGTTAFTVENTGTGTMNWTAEADVPWITIENGKSGTNDGIITISCESHSGDERIGKITVTTPDSATQTIQVVQNRSSVCENTPDWLIRPSDFEYQLMITAELRDNELSASDCDLLAAFVGDELRGVTVPKNTSQGVLYFLQVWSNQSSDEIVTFRYYNSDNGDTYPISESLEFNADKSYGSITDPYQLEIKGDDPAPSGPVCNVDPADYEFNGSITAKVLKDHDEMSDEADILMAYAGDECRGTASPDDIPDYGPRFFLQVWSNSNGEVISYKYYDSSEKRICDALEDLEFESDMMIGSILEPAVISLGDCTRVYGLQDVILVLKMLAGSSTAQAISDMDANGDGEVGLADGVYMLREISSL